MAAPITSSLLGMKEMNEMRKNTNHDYLNEQYFEDWGVEPQDNPPQTTPPQTEDFDGPENNTCDGDY